MIYTVTFNPSLDYIVSVDNFQQGIVNRTRSEVMFPGGKGINVSIVLKNLGFTSTALGFTAGFTGNEIVRRLDEMGVTYDFIQAHEGMSRINVKIKSNQESEINGQGPVLTKKEMENLYHKLDRLKAGDILVLAGSIPDCIPQTIYMDIMKYLADRNIRIVVDATKSLLMNVISCHPFLVKPNIFELGEVFGVTITDKEEARIYAKKLQDMGAENVLVSMAGNGAVLLAADGHVYEAEAPQGRVVNSVGAGDSMVAGFIAGFIETDDYKEAFLYGLCTGSASAFSEGFAAKEDVEGLIRCNKVNIVD